MKFAHDVLNQLGKLTNRVNIATAMITTPVAYLDISIPTEFFSFFLQFERFGESSGNGYAVLFSYDSGRNFVGSYLNDNVRGFGANNFGEISAIGAGSGIFSSDMVFDSGEYRLGISPQLTILDSSIALPFGVEISTVFNGRTLPDGDLVPETINLIRFGPHDNLVAGPPYTGETLQQGTYHLFAELP